jgi:hypothetical protein
MGYETATEQLLSTEPLPLPKIFTLSQRLSDELRAALGGDIKWLIFLKGDNDLVNIGVPSGNPLIQINGCSGKVELFKPTVNPGEPALTQVFPERESPETTATIDELLIPRAHAQLIAMSYAAKNTCLNINGHRVYR